MKRYRHMDQAELDRLVRESEAHVVRAEELLADLERTGQDRTAGIVRDCLASFSATLAAQRAQLERLRGRRCPVR
jgi:hypothetical protein